MSNSAMQDIIDGYTKAARESGRGVRVQYDPSLAYLAGKQAALGKLDLESSLDLVGLGMLGVPLVHDIATDEHKESPGMRRAKKITELAGLATLAASTLAKHH